MDQKLSEHFADLFSRNNKSVSRMQHKDWLREEISIGA